ncbi:MAG: phospholipid carrier-dependent glycosyltransferase [Planctomycetota bacterium]
MADADLDSPARRGPAASGRRPILPWWLLGLLPLLAAAALRDLWAPDEPRRAEVAREMFERGDFLVMHLCGEVYPDKPPLFFWLAGTAGRITGWSVFAMRLVPLLATAATAALVALLARRWWGRREALWAPLLFLGSGLVLLEGSRLQIDPLLVLLCTAALAIADLPARSRGRASAHRLLAGLATGLAGLAKGPVAFAIVGLVLLGWRLVARPQAGPRPAVLARLGGILFALLPVAAWALAAIAAAPELAGALLYGQHVGRVVEGEAHPGPWWQHLAVLPAELLPWTPLVIGGLIAAWRTRRAPDDLHRAAAWLLVLLALFSLLPTKRDLYLLPAYPAAALVGARWMVLAFARTGGLPRAATWTATAVLALAAAAALAAIPFVGEVATGVAGLGGRLAGTGAILAGGVVACGLALRRGGGEAWARTFAGAWIAATTVGSLLILPAVDEVKSGRGVAEFLAARPERPEAIPCLGVQPEGYRFYGRVPAVRDDDLAAALRRDGAQFLALARERDWEKLSAAERASFVVLHRERVGSRMVLVLGAATSSTGR